MAGEKSTIEELVSDRVAIFLKQQGSAVTMVPFREPMMVQLDLGGNVRHPGKIIADPQFNRKGWKQGYTLGEIIGERVMVQYYRHKVEIYDPPGN